MPQGETPILMKNLRREILYYRALLGATKSMLEAIAKDVDVTLAKGVRRRGRAINKIQGLEARLAGILGAKYPEILGSASEPSLKEHREKMALMLLEQLELDKEVEFGLKTKKASVREELVRVRSRHQKPRGSYGLSARRGVYLDRTS